MENLKEKVALIYLKLQFVYHEKHVSLMNRWGDRLIGSHPIGHHEDIVKVGGAYSDIPL